MTYRLTNPLHALGKPRKKDLRVAAQEALKYFPWYTVLEQAGFPEVLPLLLDVIDAARQVRDWHMPDPENPSDIGWQQGGGYGTINPACRTCGHPGEYAEPWPCPTYTLLNDTLQKLDPPSPVPEP